MNKYILLLLSIVLCLISIYLFNNKNTSTIEDDNNFSVSDTSTIQKIFIADRSGTTIHLDRNEKNWIVNEKYQVRKEAINLLLSTINKLEIDKKELKKLINSDEIISGASQVEPWNQIFQ